MRHLLFRLLPILLAASGVQAAPPASEAAVKAAFVYNFSKFAEWPPEAFQGPNDPLRVCLYGGGDPFLAALAEIDGKITRNRPIAIQPVARPAEFRGCHVLVIGESEVRQLPEALRSAEAGNMLSIAEIGGFAEAGGMIGLVIEEEKVRFEINLDSALRARLKLSSQLLKLARRVLRR